MMQQLKEEKHLVQGWRRLSFIVRTAVAAVVLIAAYLCPGRCSFFEQVTVLGLGLSLGATLSQLCHFAEVWLRHSASRYHSSLLKMRESFFNNAPFSILFVVVLITRCVQPEADEWRIMGVTASLFMLLKIVGVLNPTPMEIFQICEQRKMNVAHGLAWSFYVGYLKLVLPKLQTSIEQYHRDKWNNQFLTQRDSWKIHILVPLSACTPDQLEDVDQCIKFFDNLPEISIDRAGVRNRVYKHSLYAVKDSRRWTHYCLVEYATPLQTLYQMSHDSSAGFGVKERRQQVLLFYQTLKDILENSTECRNRYQLILLDDECDKDPHLLSKEILKYLPQPEEVGLNAPPPPMEFDSYTNDNSLFSLSTSRLEISSPVEDTYLSSK